MPLSDLPIDIISHIFSLLNLADMDALSRTNKALRSRFLAKDNLLWKQIFVSHFKSMVAEIEKKRNINWRREFRDAYKKVYATIPSEKRKLFSIVKENNERRFKLITLHDLSLEDSQGNTLWDWVIKNGNQKLFDYLFERKLRSFSKRPISTRYLIHCNRDEGNHIIFYPSMRDSSDYTLLYWAIFFNQASSHIGEWIGHGSLHLGLDKSYSESYHDVNKHLKSTFVTRQHMNYHPIHVAILLNNPRIVALLVDTNPNVLRMRDAHCRTPLMLAAAYGCYQITQFLLTQPRTHINARRNHPYHSNALHLALINKHEDIALTLLRAGINVDDRIGSSRFHAMHLAAQNGLLRVMIQLLANHPERLNLEDSVEKTPLIWAAMHGHIEVVSYLLSQPNINLTAPNRPTTVIKHDALYWAVMNNHREVANALMLAGATIVHNPNERSVVHVAAEKGRIDILRDMLNLHPEYLNITDGEGQTPLMWAVGDGHINVVEYLLNQPNIELHHKSNREPRLNWTALHWAAYHGHNDIVLMLVKKDPTLINGANVYVDNINNKTQAVIALALYINKKNERNNRAQSGTLTSRLCCFFPKKPSKKSVLKTQAAESLLGELVNNNTEQSRRPDLDAAFAKSHTLTAIRRHAR